MCTLRLQLQAGKAKELPSNLLEYQLSPVACRCEGVCRGFVVMQSSLCLR